MLQGDAIREITLEGPGAGGIEPQADGLEGGLDVVAQAIGGGVEAVAAGEGDQHEGRIDRGLAHLAPDRLLPLERLDEVEQDLVEVPGEWPQVAFARRPILPLELLERGQRPRVLVRLEHAVRDAVGDRVRRLAVDRRLRRRLQTPLAHRTALHLRVHRHPAIHHRRLRPGRFVGCVGW